MYYLELVKNDSTKPKYVEDSVSQKLLLYLKQQILMAIPVIPEMQRLHMDSISSRRDLGEDEKARQYMQLQNRFLTYKSQVNSIPEATSSGPSEYTYSQNCGTLSSLDPICFHTPYYN